MTTPKRYDAIIIGSGQAGTPLASALADAGWSTALIERRYVGGTCINFGCTPTKTMVASARMAHMARNAKSYGVRVGDFEVSLPEIRQRKQAVVQQFRQSNRQRLEQAENVELIEGEASFIGPKELLVRLNDGPEERTLTAETIIINTGARPRQPKVQGLGSIDALTSTTIMELDTLPDHLLVLGGGYVGLEFGQMFRRFGSKVTIVQRSDQLLTREDSDIAEEVADILRAEDIQILLEAEATAVERAEDGKLRLSLQSADGPEFITGSHLLIAAGRVPNTETLELSKAGVELDDRGHIQTDDYLHTNVDGIYAVGDVKGGPAFTHISYDDFRVLKNFLLDENGQSIRDRFVPYTVFIDPQLGRVGMTEEQAREAGHDIKVARLPMSYVARAIEVGETKGLMKAVIDAETDQVLGVAFLGIEGGELMGAVQIAMMGNVPYTALRDSVFAHPTLVESFNNLFATIEE